MTAILEKKDTRLLKHLTLKDAALTDNCLKGDANFMGYMDRGGDVIFPGAFQKCLARFLEEGFVANSHDWEQMVAMPLLAEERGAKLYTEAEFHSTPDAQIVRTKCIERMARGLAVGLSVGFVMLANSFKYFTSGKALLDYAKKQNCDMSLFDEESILAWKTTCRGILQVDELYEYSVCAIPMNDRSYATEAKSLSVYQKDKALIPMVKNLFSAIEKRRAIGIEIEKGEYLDGYDIGYAAMSAISRLFSSLMYGPLWDAFFDDDMTPEDRDTMIHGAFDEFASICATLCGALMASADTTTLDSAGKAIQDLWSQPDSNEETARAALSYQTQIQTALEAVERCVTRGEQISAIRAKDNRTLGSERREQLAALKSQIEKLLESKDQKTTVNPVQDVDPDQLLALRLQLLKSDHARREAALAV